MNTFIIVLVTAKDSEEAEKIAKGLLNKKLVACVNVLEGVRSLFWWEGKVDEASEALLVIKSQKKHFKAIVQEVKALHSYSVPEVIALPIESGNPDYLEWIKEST